MRELVQLLERVVVAELLAQILHDPHAHDIFEVAIAVVVAALVREIVALRHRRAVRDQALDAHQRPRSRAQIDAVIRRARHRHDRRSRIVRRGQNHLRLEPDLRRDLFRECTHGGLRHGNRAKHLLRDAEHIHQLVVPILRLCTHELRRCRVRVLVLHDPRQEIVQIVGNHQKMFCRRQDLGTFLPDRHKLIDRVEDLLLNPVACVERLL